MNKILVVGGGEYQVPLIKRIVELGNQAFCIDKNPYSPGFHYSTESEVIDIINQEKSLEYAIKQNVNAVMTYGATLPLPTVAYIGTHLNLPCLPMETAELSTNKYLIKKRLFEAGCNTDGDFFKIIPEQDRKEFAVSYPCVIKPSDGSGSKGVSVVYDEAGLSSAIQYANRFARYGELYCEKFIDGEEYSVEIFVDNGEVYFYGIIKTTFIKHGLDNEDIEYGHRTPAGLDQRKEDEIKKEIIKAVRGLNITMGSVNFDVIISSYDKKPYIIDCGIRVGQNLIASHIIPLSRGVNILDNTIKQALGQRIDAIPKKQINIATRLLIYNPGIIKDIQSWDSVIGESGIVDVVLRKKIGDTQKDYADKSDTCGWVLCTGKTPDEAEKNASRARKLLKKFFVIE